MTSSVLNSSKMQQNKIRKMKLKMQNSQQAIKKRKKTPKSQTIFPLLLSATSTNSNKNNKIIKQCLQRLRLSLPSTLSSPIIALLPTLLRSRCTAIACKTAEIVGASSLISYEMNEIIVSEGKIVKGLILLLPSPERRISIASCNAILDLSSTSTGRAQLLGFSAVENLMLCLSQAAKSRDIILLKEDEFPMLLLRAAIILINSCTIEQLQKIPRKLSDHFLLYVKTLWKEAKEKRLCNGEKDSSYICNIKITDLAECIFRLSIEDSCERTIHSDQVRKSIFDLGEVNFDDFLLNYWESAPLLMRHASKTKTKQGGLFALFVNLLSSGAAAPVSLISMLKEFASCPQITSNELHILNIIKDVKSYLGCPLIYDQDIRVVKTPPGQEELHCFPGSRRISEAPRVLNYDDITKCEDSYNEGYSIALRGMELRFHSIAAIADGLAYLFGQPSIGVNLYLTPPNSQGLARHSDDHCVFVCQLFGAKRWFVYPLPSVRLPRLYEPVNNLESENETSDECKEFVLREGDILYIPRGLLHEARTMLDADEVDGGTGFSLHLTLAIEIEPPFEWEGFIHVALRSWDAKQNIHDESVPHNLHIMSMNLLHFAINVIGNLDPMFRKACLVGATSMSSISGDLHGTVFRNLIDRVYAEAKFSDVMNHLEAAVENNEDPLEHVRWLKDLEFDVHSEKFHACNTSLEDNRYMFDVLIQHRNIAEPIFLEVKHKFCGEVVFADVEGRYNVLLEKYRKVRKQYRNGMLSLQCCIREEFESTSL